MNQAHVMIDIETLGVKPGCVILSVGAVTFWDDPNSTFTMFSKHISIDSCTELGLVTEPESVKWWSAQQKETYEVECKGAQSLEYTLKELTYYLNGLPENTLVWSCGTDFDFPILKAAYNKLGMEVPWKYNSLRDYRTLRQLFHYIKPTLENHNKHSALADALFQAAHLKEILNHVSSFVPSSVS